MTYRYITLRDTPHGVVLTQSNGAAILLQAEEVDAELANQFWEAKLNGQDGVLIEDFREECV